MIKSQNDLQPGEFLMRFSEMAKNSKALDGDWQGDGWGIGWLDKNKQWQIKKSIHPIWKNKSHFRQIPMSTHFLVHARSASFPAHKDNLEFNQPFNSGQLAFLFNGLIKGVSLPYPTPGKIGSQKIWHILSGLIRQSSPEEALQELRELLLKHSRSIQALNIGLSDGKTMYAFCHYEKFPEYYNLHHHESDKVKMVSSDPLEGYNFFPTPVDTAVVF